MRGEPVPEQEEGVGAQLAHQRGEKRDQALGIVAVRFELKEQPAASAVPALSEGGGRHPFLVEGRDENGRFVLRDPRPANGRAWGEAGFVYGDEPATLAPDFV